MQGLNNAGLTSEDLSLALIMSGSRTACERLAADLRRRVDGKTDVLLAPYAFKKMELAGRTSVTVAVHAIRLDLVERLMRSHPGLTVDACFFEPTQIRRAQFEGGRTTGWSTIPLQPADVYVEAHGRESDLARFRQALSHPDPSEAEIDLFEAFASTLKTEGRNRGNLVLMFDFPFAQAAMVFCDRVASSFPELRLDFAVMSNGVTPMLTTTWSDGREVWPWRPLPDRRINEISNEPLDGPIPDVDPADLPASDEACLAFARSAFGQPLQILSRATGRDLEVLEATGERFRSKSTTGPFGLRTELTWRDVADAVQTDRTLEFVVGFKSLGDDVAVPSAWCIDADNRIGEPLSPEAGSSASYYGVRLDRADVQALIEECSPHGPLNGFTAVLARHRAKGRGR